MNIVIGFLILTRDNELSLGMREIAKRRCSIAFGMREIPGDKCETTLRMRSVSICPRFPALGVRALSQRPRLPRRSYIPFRMCAPPERANSSSSTRVTLSMSTLSEVNEVAASIGFPN